AEEARPLTRPRLQHGGIYSAEALTEQRAAARVAWNESLHRPVFLRFLNFPYFHTGVRLLGGKNLARSNQFTPNHEPKTYAFARQSAYPPTDMANGHTGLGAARCRRHPGP